MTNTIAIQIKQIYSSLNYNCSATDIQIKAEKILELLRELTNDSIYRLEANSILPALFHTINKEVKFLSAYEKATMKKNPTKKSKTDYKEAADKAIRQIHVDIFSIFQVEDRSL